MESLLMLIIIWMLLVQMVQLDNIDQRNRNVDKRTTDNK